MCCRGSMCGVYKQAHLLVVRILLARLDHKQHNGLRVAILPHSCCHRVHILSCHIIVRQLRKLLYASASCYEIAVIGVLVLSCKHMHCTIAKHACHVKDLSPGAPASFCFSLA